MTEKSTSLSGERPASRTVTPGFAEGSPTHGADSRSSLRDWLSARMSAGWHGRTSPAFSRAEEDGTLPLFSPPSPDGTFPSPPADGRTPVSSHAPLGVSAFRGECLTLDIPEFNNFRGASRSEGVVSSLSDVVETGKAPQRYSLAVNYAEALTRRAERLGYALPPTMERVLRNVLRRSASPST